MSAYERKWKQNTFNTVFLSPMNNFKPFQTLTFKKQSTITIKNTFFFLNYNFVQIHARSLKWANLVWMFGLTQLEGGKKKRVKQHNQRMYTLMMLDRDFIPETCKRTQKSFWIMAILLGKVKTKIKFDIQI